MTKLQMHEGICTRYSANAHPVASILANVYAHVHANVYADVHNTRLTYTSAHAWCPQHCTCMVLTRPVEKHTTLSTKNAYALVHARIFNGAEASLPCSYCELILSLARASCRLSFAARPTAVRTKPVARRSSLKKSVQMHASS